MTEDQLVATAAGKADPYERTLFLEQACGADAALRQRVEARLSEPDANADVAFDFLGPSARPGALGRLGHYDVLEVVGRGGFGVVLKAFDDQLHRVVALKVLAADLAAHAVPRQRFLREARAAAPIRQENVVQVHAIKATPVPYLVMEFVPGGSLQAALDAEPLPEPAARRIGAQLARGLAAAHALGLVHRDVKPANVLLEDGPEPRAKLTDFGLALSADDERLSRSGTVAGTPLYMAPEQARGEELDARADLFSLGSVLYAMATGQPPFTAQNAHGVLWRIAEEEPTPLRELAPAYSDDYARIVARLHAKNPAERFASATEVAAALAEAPGATPVAARSMPRTPTNARHVVVVAATLALVAGAWAWSQRGNARPAPANAENPPPLLPPAASPRVAPVPGEWRSLIPKDQPPEADAVGQWRVENGALVSGRAGAASLLLAAPPAAEYDLRLEFTRRAGQHSVGAVFVHGGRQAAFEVDAWQDGLGGIQLIAGQSYERAGGNPTRRTGMRLRNGQRYTMLVEVRRGEVRGLLDGREIARHATDGADLSVWPGWLLRDPERLAVFAYESETVFHAVEIRPVK